MKTNLLKIGRHVLRNEANSILALERNLNAWSFLKALRLLREAKGKIVITGIGKAGIVARKIAATLSSTGTFSLFVHPVEALHGDLGMLGPGDVVVIISHSGETAEILSFVKAIGYLKSKRIAITAHERSTLAKNVDVVLATHVKEEACTVCRTFNLAPTTSSIVALALGDALAVALQESKEIRSGHFAKVHPGGTLGKKVYNKKKHGKAHGQ